MLRFRVCLSALPSTFALLAATLVTTLHAAPPPPPHALTVGEGLVNPFGFHDATPTFSWKLPIGVTKQSAYRVESTTANGSRWDSGWIATDQSTFARHSGPPFASRQRVEWRVRYRDEKGEESPWSAPARFELGLLSSADWTAKWIRPAQALPEKTEPVGCLQRAFTLAKPVKHARLYATARGLLAFELNGRRVGRDHFANGFTAYAKRIDTLTYDVTDHLRPGTNRIDALLGTGWYAGRFPFETPNYGPYGRDIALLAQLEIHYVDGSRETLVSDENWQGTFDGPIVASSLYDGEAYDARRSPTNWTPVATAPIDLAAGPRLAPKPFPPVRATQTLTPRTITEPQPGRFVFDLGQNIVGWARIRVPVERDGTVTLRFAEMLQADGTLYTASYRTAKSTDTYTAAAAGIVEWEPRFTFHGFRYVELSGLPAGVRPEADWVTGVVLHTDLPVTGTFVSSHAKLNQLQNNIAWGWRGNSLDIPTDCPQRDERMGWTGDAQVFAPTSLFNTGAHAFWTSWLATLRDEQDADGAIPDVIPTAGVAWRARSPGWMDAATFIPWALYVRTGDLAVLTDNYTAMEKLVAWYRTQTVDGLLPTIGGFGDWLQPWPQTGATDQDWMKDRKGDTPRPLLGLAYYAQSARILADAARALGRTEDADRYAAEAANVRRTFAAHYFDAAGKLQNAPETQTAYALALAFDLVPAPLRAATSANLVRLVGAAGDHLRTGFLGTPHLARALDETGHADVALEVLFKETYPSWFYPINQGATTMWERWNSYSHDAGFGDVSMNSFNHYAYGAIGQWLYERIAGLAPDPARPGYKHFFVRPLVHGPLESARAELETPYGRAVSAWQKHGNSVSLEIVVPPNTTATVDFPDRRPSQTLASGTHRFDCELAALR
jgi:alpha-L-rhamnosidase